MSQGQNNNQYPKPISLLITKKMPPDPIKFDKKTIFTGMPYHPQVRNPIILSDITSSHQQMKNKVDPKTFSKALIPCTAASITSYRRQPQPQNGQQQMNYNGRNENIPLKAINNKEDKSYRLTVSQKSNLYNSPTQSQTTLNRYVPQQDQNNKLNIQIQQKSSKNYMRPQGQMNLVSSQNQQKQVQQQRQSNSQMSQHQRQFPRQITVQPQQQMMIQRIPPQFQQQVMSQLIRHQLANGGGNINLRPQYQQQMAQQQQPRYIRLPNNLVMPVYNHPFNPANNPMSILPLEQLANNDDEIQYCIGKPFMLGGPGLGTPSYVADLGHFKILGVD